VSDCLSKADGVAAGHAAREIANILSDHMRVAAASVPESVHVTIEGRPISYAQSWNAARRIASSLLADGFSPGDRALFCLPNHPAMPILCTAVWLAGGVVVTASVLDVDSTIAFKIADSGARFVITGSDRALEARLQGLCADHAQAMPVGRFLPLIEEVEPGAAANADLPDVRAEDVALLQYTGGTTGEPKAAILTHANLIANGRQMLAMLDEFDFGDERFLWGAPTSHITGMSTVLLGLSVAAELIDIARFQPSEAVEIIARRRITYLIGVPTMYNAMLHEGKGSADDWSSVKYALIGGAPVTPTLATAFLGATGCRLLSGYGLSETSPAVTLMEPGSPAPDGSTGVPVPGTILEIRSLEDPHVAAPPGEAGEVCVGGPQVTVGYWNRPDATCDAFVDNLFRTGDIGFLDEFGHLHLVDRLKDMIIASGFNVYPARVEEAIYRHPDVREVAVIGEADDYRGETVKAVIALRPDATLSIEELQSFLKGDLSPIEMPRRLSIVDELPKSSAGKILRRAVRAE
jgi:long-chain acyl-CoA synthetase